MALQDITRGESPQRSRSPHRNGQFELPIHTQLMIDPKAMHESLTIDDPDVALDLLQTFFRQIGRRHLRVELLLECASKLDSMDAVSASSCRGLALTVQAGITDKALTTFIQSKGDMLQVWAGDTASITQFLQRFPQDAKSLAIWACRQAVEDASRAQNQGNRHNGSQKEKCKLLSLPPPPPPPTPWEDLRKAHPPPDQSDCNRRLDHLISSPRSPRWCPILCFVPEVCGSARVHKWLWWSALAEICIFVNCVYGSAHGNGRAGGNDGAMSVTIVDDDTIRGTVTWFRADGRIEATNGNAELWRRLQAAFFPWKPDEYKGPGKTGKVPKQIVEAYPHLSWGWR